MREEALAAPPPRAMVAAAFAAVYVIWGSTYLAIAVAVETLPPLLMVSARCLAAGAILLAWARLRGAPWPQPGAWAASARQSVLLFGAYGLVAWAEQRVASGPAAVVGAMSPLFVVLLDARARARAGVLVGVGLGLAGVILLAAPRGSVGGLDPGGTAALLGAALLWGAGAVRARSEHRPGSTLMGTSMELLSGSALMLGAGLVLGEAGGVRPDAVSARSLLAVAYLALFGSVVAYTAFHWLLQVSTPALVSTHAYVNPVIALALGWMLRGESVTATTVTAAGLVLVSVMLVAARSGEGARR